MQVGIDTGGTFTDFVYILDGAIHIHKVPSTPADPSEAIVRGLTEISPDGLAESDIIHGTTVATNALLERKGARVALVTTAGFEDVIEIGRQNRAELYDIFWQRPEPLVEPGLRVGVSERTTYDGRILKKLDAVELERILGKITRLKVEGAALCLLHSYANPDNENRVARYLEKSGVPVSVSSRILPEFREYERASTVVANAYLLPKVKSYMTNLEARLSKQGSGSCGLSVMQSSGGVITPEQAGREPVRILLSGPAGGVVGAFRIAESTGEKKVITYDMGGTSTDVALCDGTIRFTTQTSIDGIPVKVPMIDVTTIGAGGGSIAFVDAGGALKVGPSSAGADPGPACYGRGSEPTVTDANVVLGRIRPGFFLGGRMSIYPERSEKAVARLARKLGLPLADTAEGIIKVANTNMERALRVISIGKGHDPRDFSLLSFGGGGGLHACELARQMEIGKVIFPRNPGVLSALGMLLADSFRDYSATVFIEAGEASRGRLEKEFAALEKRAESDAGGVKIKCERFMDMRYNRQAHEITVPYRKNSSAIFHQTHKKMFGYKKPHDKVEIVTIRVRAVAKTKKIDLPALESPGVKIRARNDRLTYNSREMNMKVYDRKQFFPGFDFSGPAIVLEETSTLFIPPGFNCGVDKWGNIIAAV